MKYRLLFHWTFSFALAVAVLSTAGRADETPVTDEAIKAAVQKSLPLLEAGARGSMEKRKRCFTCHNQGLPIMAMVTARSRGFAIDADHLHTQVKFTADFLAKDKEDYLKGDGPGGEADTAGYAMWTLYNGDWKADETTAAVTEYFLLYQQDRDHWESVSSRPPSEESPFTTSYLALRGLKAYGTEEQKERISKRVEQVKQWLLTTTPKDTEERVFRLRALQLVDAPADEIERAAEDLKKTQREDGGWSQTAELESDAYATGSALVALHQAGGMPASDPAYRKGIEYLISTQKEDGSWHVVSRSKPFQTYFESGYPHGKDQFISIAAAGWATTALALALPESEAADGE